MKICMLTDAWIPWWGGGQTHVLEVSKKLVADHGCSVDIFVPNLTDKGSKKYPTVEEYEGGKLRIVRLGKAFTFPNLLGRLMYVKDCLKYCLSNKYDIYHSHSYFTSLPLPIIKLMGRGKVVFTLHGLGSSMLGAGVLNKIGVLNLISNFVVYKIKYDAFISVAKNSLSGKTNSKFSTVIGNGVNLEKFNRVPQTKTNNVNLLWVGRMVPVKGLPILISVFGKLVNHFPDLRLELIGDGPEKANLETEVKKLNLQNKIIFAGSIIGNSTKLIKEYKRATVYVLPSLSAEGFPITVVEAMAAKLPVVASDIGDTNLLVKNGKTGYLVSPGDEQDLYEKISKLLNNPNRNEMGIRGYDLVSSKYTWDLITGEIYKVYYKIL